jgi:ABC-type amino acid transport substrate-binding protein
MMRTPSVAAAVALTLLSCSAAAQSLTVCMAENNPPLSYQAQGETRGLDVRVAQAIADKLRRPLAIVPFESKYQLESTLSQEVNALLSSGVCDMASGFALLASDLGPPGRPTARVPDYPGAKRAPQRPWVPLGTLVPSRAYHTMAMGLVVRDPARAAATLADLGDARIGVVSGTLSGTVVSLYRNSKLRAQTVSLSQNQNVFEELEAGRLDATLVPIDRLDAWRLAHPETTLRRAAYVHPLRINIGFVARSDAQDLVSAADRVLAGALANGELQRWAEQTGTTWIAPAEPQVSASVGLADLLRE